MMKKAIYLSTNSTEKPTVIFIKINPHNPIGYLEKQNGKVGKLQIKQ